MIKPFGSTWNRSGADSIRRKPGRRWRTIACRRANRAPITWALAHAPAFGVRAGLPPLWSVRPHVVRRPVADPQPRAHPASRIPHLPVLRSQAMEDHAAPHPRVPNPHPGSRRMTEGGLEKGLANLFRKKKIAESMPAGRGPQTERRGKPG